MFRAPWSACLNEFFSHHLEVGGWKAICQNYAKLGCWKYEKTKKKYLKVMPSYFYGSLNVAVKLQVTSPKPAGTIFQARHLPQIHHLDWRKHGNEMDRKRSTFESVKCSWMLHNLFRRAIWKASTPNLGCMQPLVEKRRVSCKGENTHAPQLLMLDEI